MYKTVTKKKWVTREQVIKAIQEEPSLRAKSFFHGREEEGCPVCAVGAVLRSASFEKFMRENHVQRLHSTVAEWLSCGVYTAEVGEDSWALARELKAKRWLNALSVFFESGKTRAQCVNFIKKNFPSRILIQGSVRIWIGYETEKVIA